MTQVTDSLPVDFTAVTSPQEVQRALAQHDYLADEGLTTLVYLSLRLHRPLLLEGDAGVGKTEVAKTLARWSGSELIRLQCYEGIDLAQAAYEWDHARQLVHLRTAEAAGVATSVGVEELESQLYHERFLIRRPLLRALESVGQVPPVLLIDELDRADDEFEAFLLEFLSEFTVTIPELGPLGAKVPPVVVITSNRTRDLHDALKRRCLYHWVSHPSFEQEVQIVQLRAPEVSEALARQVAAMAEAVRGLGLYKPPGVAETIDWAQALHLLGETSLSMERANATLGTAIKYREDQERVRASGGMAALVADAIARAQAR